MEVTEKIKQRFFDKVDKDGPTMPHMDSPCWVWKAYIDKKGYGIFRSKSKLYKAHRASWMIHKGPIPDGYCVCHKCDNPSCPNPDHFFLGTNYDNVQDRERKGRNKPPVGQLNGWAKLTSDDVAQIRDLYNSGQFTQKEIAERLGIERTNISSVIRGNSWTSVHSEKINNHLTHNRKLSKDEVLTIRNLHKTGQYTCPELGKIFNVTRNNVWLIIKRKSWTHV